MIWNGNLFLKLKKRNIYKDIVKLLIIIIQVNYHDRIARAFNDLKVVRI